jgi:hypothetical protein
MRQRTGLAWSPASAGSVVRKCWKELIMTDDFDYLLDVDGTDWIEASTAEAISEAKRAGHLDELLATHDDEATP